MIYRALFFRQDNLNVHWILPCITIVLHLLAIGAVKGQCRLSTDIWDQLRLIENSQELAVRPKIVLVRNLKTEFENCKLPADSVYARILHRIALYEYLINNNNPTAVSIEYTLRAMRINTTGAKGSSGRFAVNSYSNLALYYKDLMLYDKALHYFDSTILLVNKFPDQFNFLLSSRYDRSDIFFRTGNYQQCIDESYVGFLESKKKSDTSWMITFLNQMAQSHFFQNELSRGIAAVDTAIAFTNSKLKQHLKTNRNKSESIAAAKKIYFELSTAFKTKALIFEQMGQDSLAEKFFQQTIKNRIISVTDDNFGQVAGDYSDFGNFYLNSIKSFKKANACYSKTLEYAKKSSDNERIAKAYLNLGQSFYRQHNHKLAEHHYLKSLNQLSTTPSIDFLQQPTSVQLNRIVNNEFILVYLRNRIELLLTLFKKNGETKYLKKALETAFLSDTLITRMRHLQTGERSKLFWRNYTNDTYALAMEAAYLSKDPAVAFFFMEKSRAVLLNDKLNELGSFAYLPTHEAVKEQELRNMLFQQQQAAALQANEKDDEDSELKLLQAKEKFSQYIKTLERNYPSYYQYKYADVVPSLEELKKYLAAKHQSFVHYFMGDTASYVLGISENNVRMLRIGQGQFRLDQITSLLRYFSDKQLLNNQYSAFASQSHQLYTTLFEPLQLPKGRVVICPHNFLLPFEAFAADSDGHKMLIEEYAFSYIYSARYLLKQFPQYPANGNFLGFAPVSFQIIPAGC